MYIYIFVFNIKSIYCVKDNSAYSGHNEKACIFFLFNIFFAIYISFLLCFH